MRRDPAKSDRDRLADILGAIEKIGRYTAGGRREFDESELIQSWMVLQLLVVGEAASGVSQALRERHPEIPWRRVVDMRNAMIHGYAYVDFDIVWEVIEREIPELRARIARVLEELP